MDGWILGEGGCTKQSNDAGGVNTHGTKLVKNSRNGLIVVWEVLLHHICSAPSPIPSPCF